MFAISCKAKHVPKSIRRTLELKKQSVPNTNARRFMKNDRDSEGHAHRIADMITKHGLVGERICFISGDNFQRKYRKTASASAVDPTKDSAHVVFNSALKVGDTRPLLATDMMRPTLDPDISIETTLSHIKYGVTPPVLSVSSNSSGLILLKHPSFASMGKYYHRKHFHKAAADQPYSHWIKVPTARRSACNFDDPGIDCKSPLGKKLISCLQNNMSYTAFMNSKTTPLKKFNFKQWVANAHKTRRGRGNLDDVTAMGVDDLNPGDMSDMLKWMLHMYHIILTVRGDDALRYTYIYRNGMYADVRHPHTLSLCVYAGITGL